MEEKKLVIFSGGPANNVVAELPLYITKWAFPIVPEPSYWERLPADPIPQFAFEKAMYAQTNWDWEGKVIYEFQRIEP